MSRSRFPKLSGAVIFAICTLNLACGPGEADSEAALTSLVAAERAFARSAAELGTRDAFLEYLAEDAILFRPRATNGKQFLAAQPAVPGLLSWEPAFADVSQAGDLGFTTGPWTYTPEAAAEPAAYGQYFTVWKRQTDGTWKVAIDHGSYNPPPSGPPEPLSSPTRHPSDRRGYDRDVDRLTEIERLLAKDRTFASAIATQGKLQAVNAFFMPDVRILRNGVQPRAGIESARVSALNRPGTLTWRVLGGDVSQSGDFGFTYGEYEYQAPGAGMANELGSYMRVWRNLPSTGRIWRVAVDLMTAFPPTSPAPEQ
ncbi:MAG: nuclear transport factor 2 family protein [Gemmatimonadales bacterium]|jgi:ketosteroid isomerase-like protein